MFCSTIESESCKVKTMVIQILLLFTRHICCMGAESSNRTQKKKTIVRLTCAHSSFPGCCCPPVPISLRILPTPCTSNHQSTADLAILAFTIVTFFRSSSVQVEPPFSSRPSLLRVFQLSTPPVYGAQLPIRTGLGRKSLLVHIPTRQS